MRKFYLQVTKEHRQNAKRREKEAKAQQIAQQAEAESIENVAIPRAKASENPQQSVSETPRKGETEENAEGVLSIRNFACLDLTGSLVAAEGQEQRNVLGFMPKRSAAASCAFDPPMALLEDAEHVIPQDVVDASGL